jgi:hypothetical protein
VKQKVAGQWGEFPPLAYWGGQKLKKTRFSKTAFSFKFLFFLPFGPTF